MGGVSNPVRGPDSSREDRFCALYERWHGPIHAYCCRRLDPATVDDAVAETFVVAWRRLDDVPPGRDALLWLYRVAYRVIGHVWRGDQRRRRLNLRLERERFATPARPDERIVDDDECRRVLDALERLKPSEAEILRLVAWEGLSPTDLSIVLDVRPNTASQRLARARQHLARVSGELQDRPGGSPIAREGGSR